MNKLPTFKIFAGSLLCPELQKLLKPIYDLTRKGRPFIWGKEQQDSFEEIKHRLIKPPVLHMPKKQAGFTCILTLVNLLQAAHSTRYRMGSPNSLYMPVKDCQKAQNATL